MRRRADMEVYFRPDEERPQGDGTEDGAFPRPPSFPPEVLERHGARMLRPTEAVRAPGTRAPQPTAYRAGILLVPDDLVRGRSDVINRALGDIGLRFAPPPPPSQLAPGLDEIGQYLRDLPRPVALRVREDGMPTDVDAWVALQHLRAVAGRGGSGLRREDVDRMSLDHLLIGSAITGSGGSPVTEGSPLTEGSGIGSYVRAGSGGRCPVDLAMPAPYRRHLRDCGTNRRPVVAVLDTGIRSHPWLDVPRYGDPLPANGFVRIDPALQALIRAEEEQVAATSLDAVEVLVDHWDTPATSAPLVGTLDSHLGHGTFIARLVRKTWSTSSSCRWGTSTRRPPTRCTPRRSRRFSTSSAPWAYSSWRPPGTTRRAARSSPPPWRAGRRTRYRCRCSASARSTRTAPSRCSATTGRGCVASPPARPSSAPSRPTSTAAVPRRSRFLSETSHPTGGAPWTRTTSAAGSRCGAAPRSPRRWSPRMRRPAC